MIMNNNNNFITLVGIVCIVLFTIITNSIFIVDQRHQALVLQFGEIVKVVKEPGFHFKTPLVQEVLKMDKRILHVPAEDKEVIARDKKRLVVNAFAKYKIVDPQKFYQTVKDEHGLSARINNILDSSLRQVIGSVTLPTLLKGDRIEVMRHIMDILKEQSTGFGIDIVDVRILRADLPEANSKATYERMITDRKQDAAKIRAEGKEKANFIKAQADKESKIIVAEAEKKANIMRGQGDGQAAKIYADMYNQDTEFFSFYRSMQAYKNSFDQSNTSVVISSGSKFMKYFGNEG